MKMRNKNNLPQKYISEVKALFPITRKTERIYLRQMKQNIDDYCEQSSVSTMEELHKEFGKPLDVVYNYYSMMDMETIFSYIRIRQIIIFFATFICAIILSFTLFISIILYQEHLMIMREEAVFIETVISD